MSHDENTQHETYDDRPQYRYRGRPEPVDVTSLDSDALRVYLENQDQKADSQRRMAWIALTSGILAFVALLFPVIPVERVNALDGVITTFFLSQASIVGLYFGAQAYMSRNTY